MFNKIKGQDRVISILKRAIEKDKIAHSYLFYGPDGVGKFTTALYFGMAINCLATHDKRPCGACNSCKKFLSFTHPDFIYTFPFPNPLKSDISASGEIKSDKAIEEYQDYVKNKIKTPWKEFFFTKNIGIRIGSIRMLEHRIYLTPHEANYKIFIIENAELMTVQAANAFLKTLEEPPNDSIIILTTSKPNSLLPTILSRCQKIQFAAISRHLIEKELEKNKFLEKFEIKMYARIANGNMEKALRLIDEGRIESREKTIEFLKFLLSGNDLHFIEFVKKYKTSKTQTQLVEIISHLIIWLADISYFKYCQEEIVNLDKTELIESLYNKNQNVEEYVSNLTEFLEKMLRRLEGHVNPQLIFTEIYNEFKVTFFGKTI